MSTTTAQCPHVSGQYEANEPRQHGINDGSGKECLEHSSAAVDHDGKMVSRDETLTEILISKGLSEVNLISAIVSLGEGELNVVLMVFIDFVLP